MSRSAGMAAAAAGLTVIGLVMLPSGAARAGFASVATSAPHLVVSDATTDVGAPALSSSGRYLAYMATRRDQDPRRQELRRLDVSSGLSQLLNPAIGGGLARGRYSRPPVISADGSRVGFTSNAPHLVAADTNGRFDAFVRDAATGTTLLASRAFDGGVANGDSGMASLSKSGRFAVFTSSATDVVPGSTTTNSDVYRADLDTRTTVQVTVRPNGAPSKGPGSSSADVSADGHLVAFNSYNRDLAPTDGADHEADLFIRNMTTGTTRWLSPDLPVGANPTGVVISPDGMWVSSRWDDGSLHLTRTDTAVTATVVGQGYALLGAFSAQQHRFVFVSEGRPWVRDLLTGVNMPIDSPDGGTVTTVTISGNGEVLAYDWSPDDGGPSRIFTLAL